RVSHGRPRRQSSVGLGCTQDCELHPRLAPSATAERAPRHVRNREDHDTRKGRAIGPDLVVDPVADESGYVRVVPQVAPERLARLYLRRHTFCSLLSSACMATCSASALLASPAGRSQGLGCTRPTTRPRLRPRLRPPTTMSWPYSTRRPYQPLSPGPTMAVALVLVVLRSSMATWISSASVP